MGAARVSVSDVMPAVDSMLAYSTIKSILSNLVDKGLKNPSVRK
jgi:predicted transcriptional regulator